MTPPALIGCFVIIVTLYLIFTMTQPAQWSIYGYLALWLFFPKALRVFYLTGGSYDLPRGLTVFKLLEILAGAAIALNLLCRTRPRITNRGVIALQRLCLVFLALATLTYAASSGWIPTASYADFVYFMAGKAEPQARLLAFASAPLGVIFLFGCAAFIRTQRQIEVLFVLLMLSGLELGAEFLLIYQLQMVPFLTRWVTAADHSRFNSIAFTNYDLIGAFGAIIICASLYFILTRGGRTMILGAVALLCALVVVQAGYQRGPLVGCLAGAAWTLWLIMPRGATAAWIWGGLALLVAAAALSIGGAALRQTGRNLGGEIRGDRYFSAADLQARIGLWRRASEETLTLFPFGAGAGAVGPALAYPVTTHLDGWQLSSEGLDEYLLVSSGSNTTETHNSITEFLVENGLLGLPLVAGFALIAWQGLRRFFAAYRRVDGRPKLMVAAACTQGVIVGLAIQGMFNATTMPYGIYFVWLYLSVYLLDLLPPQRLGRSSSPPVGAAACAGLVILKPDAAIS